MSEANKTPKPFSFRGVALVADVALDDGNQTATSTRRDLELTDLATLDALVTAIKAQGLSVTHYESPDALARNAEQHRDHVVLSIYGGQGSRNRMVLVPAVCEAFGLRFIGPDAYGRFAAQDKEVSKRLALDCGLRTPTWRVLRTPEDVARLTPQSVPAVVKPLMEGSSIGIGPDSLVRDLASAQRVALRLLREFDQPVMIESFVAGREVALVAIEQGKDIAWAYTEVVIDGQPEFFEQRLFDATEKVHRTQGRTVRDIDAELAPDDAEAIKRLLKIFSPFGYARVDGRHANGQFHFIEFTPDAWIDPRGQFAMGFTEKGWSYDEVIAAVLASVG